MRRLVPEVVQTSEMDCGPAALKSLLEGFGVHASYGRLREACQIDLDGTSIDALEEVAVQLGLEAEQVMVPLDHLLLPEARCLPALVVVRQPNGVTHFVVVWSRHGRLLQVMDPATGRRWPTVQRFLDDVYVHRMAVPAAGWREWAGSEEFLAALKARLGHLGLTPPEASEAVTQALTDPGWQPIAALDAAARMVLAVVDAGGLARGGEAARLLRSLVSRSDSVPETYWSVRPGSEGELLFRGAVLVRVKGRKEAEEELSPELAAALAEPPSRPGRELLRFLLADGRLAPGALLLALTVAGLGVVLETLLFRSFFDLGPELETIRQRSAAISLLVAVIALFLLLDLPITQGTLRLGRHLEMRLRMAFLRKIPRLGDRYFQSRLTSDMADRSHGVHRLRLAPDLGESFVRASSELLFTLGGIVWLDPGSAPLALLAGALTLAVPLVLLPRLQEWDLRVRNHAGAISRFYLDGLLGLFPIRTHGAQKAVRRQHEGLLAEWARAYLHLRGAEVVADTAVQVAMVSMAVALLFSHLARKGLDGGALLLVYWSLKILTLGHMLILAIATQYPSHRNVALRLLEPLGAPEEAPEEGTALAPAESPQGNGGLGIRYEGVSVRAGGHTILEGIDLEIEPGAHVAIVGPSGAGKSTLVGVLLGWHRPAEGRVLVDGEALSAGLRRETAWVDPGVQIWNRSLLENLRYGNGAGGSIGRAVDLAILEADLAGVLRKLPDGLQTQLGEGGGLVSGGEGQRVRLGRALLRPGTRLALLDEPFRGLDRERRRELLARARRLWEGSTLLCVTHDVGETQEFARVLVVEGGRIVEDGSPGELAERPGSRYRALLDAEREVREGLWESPVWRRLRMEGGALMNDLAWPADRLGEALQALARRSGLGPGELNLDEPSETADLGAWIITAASAMGLEAEPVDVSYREIELLVRQAAPALLRLPGEGPPSFLILLRGGRRSAVLLDPERRPRKVPVLEVAQALRREHDDRLGPEVDRLLDEAEVPAHRRDRARAALLAERLGRTRIGGAWILDLPPGGSFGAALRHARLPGRATALVGAHMMQHALLLVSWWVLGRGVLQGRLDAGWLLAWALLQFTVIPFRTLEIWSAGVLMARAGRLLKRRLMMGALRVEPEETRHQGAGQLLGRILNSEALEFLALTGGHIGLITLSEIVLALPVLAAGAAGWLHALLLLAWVAVALGLSWRYFRQRRAWTLARLEMTHDLVEQMVGHRTRLAQQSEDRWHDREDRQLERYLDLSSGLDGRAVWLRVLIPRGWLLLSLVAIARPFITGEASAASLAVSLGGALFAYWSLWKMVRGLADLAEAAVAWKQVAPIFHAAGRSEAVALETVSAISTSSPSAVVVEGHDLVFRYGERADPAVAGASLRICSGERLLLEGPSGGGKSTLGSLLSGLRVPQSGLLLLQGLDRQSLGLEGWRRRVVAAPQFQENHVLTDTLLFNLLMGREWPPRPGDAEEAEEVCRELGLGDLLDRMPSGLLQMVGESGWQLSHGEKSRLYIARALLQNAELVVLDESFAALDPESLRQALACVLRRARTLLVIAHP